MIGIGVPAVDQKGFFQTCCTQACASCATGGDVGQMHFNAGAVQGFGQPGQRTGAFVVDIAYMGAIKHQIADTGRELVKVIGHPVGGAERDGRIELDDSNSVAMLVQKVRLVLSPASPVNGDGGR